MKVYLNKKELDLLTLSLTGHLMDLSMKDDTRQPRDPIIPIPEYKEEFEAAEQLRRKLIQIKIKQSK